MSLKINCVFFLSLAGFLLFLNNSAFADPDVAKNDLVNLHETNGMFGTGKDVITISKDVAISLSVATPKKITLAHVKAYKALNLQVAKALSKMPKEKLAALAKNLLSTGVQVGAAVFGGVAGSVVTAPVGLISEITGISLTNPMGEPDQI